MESQENKDNSAVTALHLALSYFHSESVKSTKTFVHSSLLHRPKLFRVLIRTSQPVSSQTVYIRRKIISPAKKPQVNERAEVWVVEKNRTPLVFPQNHHKFLMNLMSSKAHTIHGNTCSCSHTLFVRQESENFLFLFFTPLCTMRRSRCREGRWGREEAAFYAAVLGHTIVIQRCTLPTALPVTVTK